MFSRFSIFIAGAALSACVAQPRVGEQPAPPDAAVAPVASASLPVKTVPVEDPFSASCELLLWSLEQTRPVLSSLDQSLAGQAERLERAIDRLDRPAPVPVAAECPVNDEVPLGDKEIIGGLEWLYMDPPGTHYRARVDSGAETSSLSAGDVVEFERDGDDWVRFTFQHDSTDEPVEFELPIERTVLIRQVSSDELQRRFVVEIDIRLGEQLQTTEFTLTDRSSMTYPILLGRAFLMDLYVVDVSRSYTHAKYQASD